MGRFKHKTLTKRRAITAGELALALGCHRHTMRRRIFEYGGLEMRDVIQIVHFIRWYTLKYD